MPTSVKASVGDELDKADKTLRRGGGGGGGRENTHKHRNNQILSL